MISENTLNLYLKTADKLWHDARYDQAIKYYKKYLRFKRKNVDVWVKLGACYCHTAQLERAKKILMQFAHKATAPSMGFFYLGVSNLLLNQITEAKQYLYKATFYTDNYADMASYELIVMFYNNKNVKKTQEWIKFYKTKFPKGMFIQKINAIANRIDKQDFSKTFEGTTKPDIEMAIFKYNKFSLFNYPHYWFLQSGFDYKEGIAKDPDPGQQYGLKDRAYSIPALIINAGIGVGPIKKGTGVSWAGYTYKQHWFSSTERFQNWSNDYMDFDYFPFKSDLLERTHELYFQASQEFNSIVGRVYLQLDFVRIGSNYMPSNKNYTPVEQKNTSVSRSLEIIPEVGIKYYDYFETLLYLYIKRELNDEMSEYSFKTYNFTSGNVGLSLGVRQKFNFPKYKLSAFGDLFYFDLTYNDPWLSRKSLGLYAESQIEFLPYVFIYGGLGYKNEIYKLKILKQFRCSGLSAKNDILSGDSSNPVYCLRIDTGINYNLGLYWIYKDSFKVQVGISGTEINNPQQLVYEKSDLVFAVLVTAAFPSISRYNLLTENQNRYKVVEPKD